jgi:glutamate---cysteine ligase / carboxylate-amine ligase
MAYSLNSAVLAPETRTANGAHKFTLGIEEEFQVIDPETRDLTSHIHQIVDDGKTILLEQVKNEMHTAVVEVATNVCENIADARREVTKLRRAIFEQAAKEGLLIASAGTHPFARWADARITDMPRYREIVDELQDAARGNLIFGLHVHVGIPSREEGLQIMNTVRYFLPHIFALSTNSPFWEGRDTGYRSYRTKVFDKFPRTGIPDYFSSASEYDDYIKLLVKTGCIDNGKKIWWDIRLHPVFNTVEFRVCDVPMRVDETIALAAVMQALVVKLYKLMQSNLNFRLYRRALISENKWRASRFGIDGKLIDFGKQEEVDTRVLIGELLEFIDDVLDELGSRKEVEYIHEILRMGTGADRQRAEYQRNGGDLIGLMDFIVRETALGV